MKILAVDDDPLMKDLLDLALAGSVYSNFEFTTSGSDAIRILSEGVESFSCFLLDMYMPNFDGVELCRRIRNIPDYKDTPIIMISRLDHRLHMERAIVAGATDYIVKPFDGQEVVTRIELADCRRIITMRSRKCMSMQASLTEDGYPKPFQYKDLPVFL
ncbi:response regulator [Roseivivax sp. CAU 1753]